MRSYGPLDIFAISANLYIRLFTDPNDKDVKTWAGLILFLRFTHFGAMAFPLTYYLKYYTLTNRKRQRQIISVFNTFVLMIFLAHILACYLIVFGTDDDETLNATLWVANN